MSRPRLTAAIRRYKGDPQMCGGLLPAPAIVRALIEADNDFLRHVDKCLA